MEGHLISIKHSFVPHVNYLQPVKLSSVCVTLMWYLNGSPDIHTCTCICVLTHKIFLVQNI